MVLVAEDHQINLDLILAVLDAAGCETELAASGQQALAKLDKADFDLTCIASKHAGRQYIEAVATTLHLSGECAAAFNVWGRVL